MGRGHCDGHAGFTSRDLAQSVGDADSQIVEGALQFDGDGLQPASGHGAIGIVGDAFDRTLAMSAAHRADKQHHGSTRWMARGRLQSGHVDDFVDQ